jgi:peroxiredoxin
MKKSILLFACIVFLVAAKPAGEGYDVGDTATDFKLKNVDGKMVSLADYTSAKGFIVIFDCNTCPYSKAYNDRILGLSKKYTSQGFPLLAINANAPELSPGDSYEDMKKYAKAKGYDFPYLIDETQSVAKAYGATNTPHVFVLSKTGKEMKVAYIGTIDDSPRDPSSVSKRYVEDAVDALLSGKEVAKTKTKAIGCGIKFKDA